MLSLNDTENLWNKNDEAVPLCCWNACIVISSLNPDPAPKKKRSGAIDLARAGRGGVKAGRGRNRRASV